VAGAASNAMRGLDREDDGESADVSKSVAMITRDLTCLEVVALIMDYLDDTLAAAPRVACEAHLAECRDCLAYLRSYRETVAMAKAAGAADDPAAADMPEELVQAILAARRSRE
jgi:anti-sigma factor RsiW